MAGNKYRFNQFDIIGGAGAEEKTTLHNRGQQIVAKAQIQDLSKVIQLLDSVLSDRQKKYYVVIDKLDENWVEDSLRYKLIMALIVTLKDLTRVSNAKVIITMRRDLIDRVFRLTRSSGFQEEKFESLLLPIKWAGISMTRLTVEKFKTAEGECSRGRLRALGDEWSADFPSVDQSGPTY